MILEWLRNVVGYFVPDWLAGVNLDPFGVWSAIVQALRDVFCWLLSKDLEILVKLSDKFVEYLPDLPVSWADIYPWVAAANYWFPVDTMIIVSVGYYTFLLFWGSMLWVLNFIPLVR